MQALGDAVADKGDGIKVADIDHRLGGQGDHRPVGRGDGHVQGRGSHPGLGVPAQIPGADRVLHGGLLAARLAVVVAHGGGGGGLGGLALAGIRNRRHRGGLVPQGKFPAQAQGPPDGGGNQHSADQQHHKPAQPPLTGTAPGLLSKFLIGCHKGRTSSLGGRIARENQARNGIRLPLPARRCRRWCQRQRWLWFWLRRGCRTKTADRRNRPHGG